MACRLPVPNHYLNQLNWFRWQYCSYEIAGAYIVIYLSFIYSFAYSILFHLFIHLSILFHLFIHLSIYLFIYLFVKKRDALFPPALTTPVQWWWVECILYKAIGLSRPTIRVYWVDSDVHLALGVRTTLNTLRLRQNGRHFADDNFKCIFLNENVWIPIKLSLKFVPKGPINNIPTLIQVMAWRRPGAKPLSEPMMVRLPTHICVTRPQWVK